MDTINTAALPQYFGDIMHDPVHAGERYTEDVFSFSEPALGSGSLHTIGTAGMRFSEFRIHTHSPVILLDTEPAETAESAFILEGDVESAFNNMKGTVRFGNQRHNFHYNTDFSGRHTLLSGRFHACTITYNPSFLDELMAAGDSGSLAAFRRHLDKKRPFLAIPEPVQWHCEMYGIIASIRQCRFEGLTRYLFIESKMMELFVLQFEHLHTLQTSTSTDKWKPADKEKIHAVKTFIEQSYLEPLSLQELCSRFALNEFKLKKGYRQFFQTTVFSHILRLRMQKAKELLREKEMNVSETAYFIGYNNVSSFSAEFKKQFGYSPAQYAS